MMNKYIVIGALALTTVAFGQKKEIKKAEKGGEFYIPIGIKHTAKAGSGDLVFLEISLGNFSEEDEVRLEDNYGREN